MSVLTKTSHTGLAQSNEACAIGLPITIMDTAVREIIQNISAYYE